MDAGSVARGSFKDAVHTPSNFGKFHVETFGNYPDRQQLYAAGYLEGYLTAGELALDYCVRWHSLSGSC